MSSRNKKEAAKNSLGAFWAVAHQIPRTRHSEFSCRQQKGWNYSDFVAYLLEVIVVLRLREKRKRDAREK
jgi:hypothetical protein